MFTRDVEMAAEARAGGRLLTHSLAYRLDQSPNIRESLTSDDPQERERAWHNAIDPAGYQGRKGWESIAAFDAHTGPADDLTDRWGPSRLTVTLADAEAMVAWPIYQAATRRDVEKLARGSDEMYDTLTELCDIVFGVERDPDHEIGSDEIGDIVERLAPWGLPGESAAD